MPVRAGPDDIDGGTESVRHAAAGAVGVVEHVAQRGVGDEHRIGRALALGVEQIPECVPVRTRPDDIDGRTESVRHAAAGAVGVVEHVAQRSVGDEHRIGGAFTLGVEQIPINSRRIHRRREDHDAKAHQQLAYRIARVHGRPLVQSNPVLRPSNKYAQ